jgi:hypothetical protein
MSALRLFALLILGLSTECWAVDILYLTTSSSDAHGIEESLDTAGAFYGVRIIPRLVDSKDFLASVRRDAQAASTVGVVIDADALTLLKGYAFREVLDLRGNVAKPILVLNISDKTAQGLYWIPALRRSLDGCSPISNGNDRDHLSFSSMRGLNHELAGLDLRLAASFNCAFAITGRTGLEPVISVLRNGSTLPVFVRAVEGSQEIFVAAGWTSREQEEHAFAFLSKFAATVVPLVFVKHAAGAYGWHSVSRYANLTVDDPWLVEPYGFLNYRRLLGEMKAHRFHTTIAFIPWNYDRSRGEVVSLFLQHPDNYSIAIHGNNHDHREFGAYEYKSFEDQRFNIRQALARMERFKELTGIPYDRVMVFPHGISPAATLRSLKTYGFVGTVNAINVPLEQEHPIGLAAPLRSTTLYENFPSTARYTAEYSFSEYPHDFSVPKELIAVNAFLGNPILLYGHHGMFAAGIQAFNETADFVNSIEPAVEWKSLGYILARSYLRRLRLADESALDVLTDSSITCLENENGRERTFHVRKAEDGDPGIKAVMVDGKAQPFDTVDGLLTTRVSVDTGRTACLEVHYISDDTHPVQLSKLSKRVWVLRTISDWRDRYLSRSSFGRLVIAAYYGNDRKFRITLILGIAVATVMVLWFGLLRRREARKSTRVHFGRPEGVDTRGT